MVRPVKKRGIFEGEPTVYGHSVNQTPLEVWGDGSVNVDLLIFAGIHGEEPDTTVLLSRALRSTSRRSPTCAVVLCANPDGLRQGTRGNANGVDLNRNFPSANWQAEPVTHRWHTDSDSTVLLSPGTAPASEPEVQALIQLVTHLEPACVVSLHSPLGLIDDPESTALGGLLAERTGMPRTVLPNHHTPGSFGSWMQDRGIPSITYELPSMSVWDMLPVHLPILHELLERGLAIAER
jgi:protein MpaA